VTACCANALARRVRWHGEHHNSPSLILEKGPGDELYIADNSLKQILTGHQMEKVSPTRMTLLSRKSQKNLASEGVELLKHKREVLLSKFMDLVKPLMDKHDRLHKEMVQAFHCLNTARAIDGWGELKSAALLWDKKVTIQISKETNWGVEIPKIEQVEGLDTHFRESHSNSISLRIYETRDRFEKILKLIFEIAPIEVALKRLGIEIQKTTRKTRH